MPECDKCGSGGNYHHCLYRLADHRLCGTRANKKTHRCSDHEAKYARIEDYYIAEVKSDGIVTRYNQDGSVISKHEENAQALIDAYHAPIVQWHRDVYASIMKAYHARNLNWRAFLDAVERSK